MLLRVVPEEGQNVLPEDSTPWAKELPSPTSHSNRSLRTEVYVAGKQNFQGRDKEAETALEIQGRRCRDKISLGNSANSGLIAGFREISVRTRMRGRPRSSPTLSEIKGLQRVRVETDPLIAKEGFSTTRTSNALTTHRCATDLPETRRPANVLSG